MTGTLATYLRRPGTRVIRLSVSMKIIANVLFSPSCVHLRIPNIAHNIMVLLVHMLFIIYISLMYSLRLVCLLKVHSP